MPSKRQKPDNLGIAASPGRRGRVSKAGQHTPLTPTSVTAITNMYNNMCLTPSRQNHNRLQSDTGSSSTTPSRITHYFQPQQQSIQTPAPDNISQVNVLSSRDSVQVLDQSLATGPPPLPPSQQCEQTSQSEINTETHFTLQEFFEPIYPLPCEARNDGETTIFSDGFHQIDKVPVNDCLLSIAPTMQDVPENHRFAFAKSFEIVFRRFKTASEERNMKDIERSLKWFLLLPHALLVQPTRGGKSGYQVVKRRFDCIVTDDWSRLLELFEKERLIVTEKNERRRNANKSAQEDPEKITRNAISLISHGKISKCANRLNSFGVVDINNPQARDSLKSKYPVRGRKLQSSVTKGTAVESFRTIQNALMNLKGGVAPGTGGLRPEFLLKLTEVWKEDEHQEIWETVNYFCMQYISGGMPPWFYKSIMTVETVGLFKTAERNPEKLRPIGMRNPFIKTIHKEIITQNKHNFKEYLEPQQLGMSVGGAAKLVHSVRMTLEKNPTFVCVKLDFRNAFNEISRARVVEALEEVETLQHLAQFAGMLLAPVSGLESGGEFWGEAQEGTTQGDPLSGPFFCVSIHKEVRKADQALQRCGGMVRCGWDDGYFLGPKEEVFQALNLFSSEVQRSSGLVLQVTKSEVYTSTGVMPSEAPAGFVKAGETVEEVFQPGFLCYGVPIGTDAYVLAMLDLKIGELEKEVEHMSGVLDSSRQSLWVMLRSSISQRLDYWLTLVYPTQIKRAAEKMDNLILKVMEKLLGCPIPMDETGEHWNCPVNVPVDGLQGRSFQNWILRLPIRSGGLGIRSNLETSAAAFIGGVEQALPHFTKDSGICSSLEDVIGDFKENNSRWTKLIQSGCRTGVEFQNSWNTMKREVQQCSSFLNKAEGAGPLYRSVEGAGDGREDGGTRRLIVQQREELRAAVLTEALSRYPDPKKRQVVAWANRDKLCTAWLQSLPGPDGFSNPEFTEAIALALCMPSPACKDRVGEKVGKSVVDVFGDSIMSAHLPGDDWRTRHDKVKMAINSLCSWARLPTTVEVWGLFAHLIPQEALNKIESGRARQGLVPDFRIKFPPTSTLGEDQVKLAELKLIGCNSWYNSSAGNKVRATNKRAQGLQADYRRKAKNLDKNIPGTSDQGRGPVERRLDEFGQIIGLCFGAWGEGSDDVHSLVETLAQCRLRFQMQQDGRPDQGSDNELALIVGQIRRRLSVTAVKAQVGCLLSRIHQVGPGNKQLAKKRQWAIQEDERMKQERHSQWMRRIEGVTSLRKGMIKTS